MAVVVGGCEAADVDAVDEEVAGVKVEGAEEDLGEGGLAWAGRGGVSRDARRGAGLA